MWRQSLSTIAVFLAFGTPLTATSELASPDFETEVQPILTQNCLACHGESSPQAQLDLRTPESILAGGKSGSAFVPGDGAESLLVSKLTSGAMPPGDSRLSEEEIGVIRLWIDRQGRQVRLASLTEKDVLPIFQMHCVNCHGKTKQEGGLDLRTQASRLKGGDSGPALAPGKPGKSLLYTRIVSREMPPLDEIRPPTTAEVETLRRWIEVGAPLDPPSTAGTAEPDLSQEDREFWSFQPPKRLQVPEVRDKALVRNPIDAFLLQSLEAEGLSFSNEAEPRVLLRRAYLDLTGMPPTPAETRAYLDDREPGAYERLLDRLLDSRHYGERWAQYWLDLAGYTDSEGIVDEDKVRPHSWRYRDYVIRAFNGDTPYDRFLTEQLAGDELLDYKKEQKYTQEMIDTLAATGFLRLTTDGTYNQPNRSLQDKMDIIADEMQVLGSSVLGLTVGCARCHDHKYDPLTQREYYSLSSIFQTALDPYDWRPPTERILYVALESERKAVEMHNAPLKIKLKKLETELEEKSLPYKTEFIQEALAKLPEEVRKDLKVVTETPKEKRTGLQRYLSRKFKDAVEPSYAMLGDRFPDFKGYADEKQKSIGHIKNVKYGSETNFKDKTKLLLQPGIRALYDMGGEPSPAYVLRRGQAQSVGERVYPAVPAVLNRGELEPYHPIKPPGRDTSGNRLGLARWLTQPNHPLTSRVQVNRIWGHHFGRALVTSPGNFGRTGSKPSHPELLDWLATEFVAQGWSLKVLHRTLMTSAAYRQSSQVSPEARKTDPENRLLSRMPLRRLDAEALHDSVLRVTGRLDATLFGQPIPLEELPSGEVVPESKGKRWRRAIYLLKRRRMPVSSLEAFDYPVMMPNCGERRESTVVIQALQLMNGDLMRDHARYLAGRLMDGAPGDTKKQVDELYLRVLARPPSSDEKQRVLASLDTLGGEWKSYLETSNESGPRGPTAHWSALSSVALTLLNSAEFLYID